MNAFKLTKQAVIFTVVCVYLPTVEEIYDLNMIYYPNNSYICVRIFTSYLFHHSLTYSHVPSYHTIN